MNDIAVIEEHVPLVPVAPQPAFLLLASPSCGQVCSALAIAQGAFKTPKRTKEATIKGQGYAYTYRYAPLEEIVDAVKDALAQNGLARHQYLVARGSQPVMRTIIWHASGEWLASDYPIHPTKEGAQGFASGVTYARRYGLSLALGLAPEDDDDGALADATAAEVKGKQTVSRPSQPKPPAPLPPEPPKVASAPEVFDPETGELQPAKPHRLLVPDTPRGGRNWPIWGSKLIGAYGHSQTLEELRQWEAQCQPEIAEAQEDAPRVFKSITGAFEKAFQRLGPPADFMPATEHETADVSR
jgi:hypothetical protein